MIERFGGERDFKFIVIAFVGRLKADRKLNKFFANFRDNDLATHQEDFLMTVFDDSRNAESVQNYIYLRYHRLFQQGFDERHYDLLVRHFVESLQDAWVDDDQVIGDTVKLMNSFRPSFERKQRQEMCPHSSSRVSIVESLVGAC